jgi:hypothetical protein
MGPGLATAGASPLLREAVVPAARSAPSRNSGERGPSYQYSAERLPAFWVGTPVVVARAAPAAASTTA